MSQAERHAKQEAQLAEQAAAMLRQRQALSIRPIPLAVRVALRGRGDRLFGPPWLYVQLGVISDPRRLFLGSGRR